MPPTRLQALKTINSSGVSVPNDPSCVLLQDGAITIGGIRIELFNSILSNATLSRNAAGDISINVAAGQNATMTFDIGGSLLKQINSLLSTVSVPTVNASGLLADGSGDSPVPKGFKITDFTLAYSVQGGPLTSASFRVDQNVFAQGVANAITAIIAAGQNGIVLANTASATTCNITKIVPAAPAFDILDNDAVFVELNVVTPGGCTFRLYELFLHVSFNYN